MIARAVTLVSALLSCSATSASDTPAFSAWIEANSNLTCTTEPPVEYVTFGQLKRINPRAEQGTLVRGVIYIGVKKFDAKTKAGRKPIVVHEKVHQCQIDSGVFRTGDRVNDCLGRETQAHELDQLWRAEHGLVTKPISTWRMLEKCV